MKTNKKLLIGVLAASAIAAGFTGCKKSNTPVTSSIESVIESLSSEISVTPVSEETTSNATSEETTSAAVSSEAVSSEEVTSATVSSEAVSSEEATSEEAATVVEINTVDEFLAFRKAEYTTKVSVKLNADIDLTGVTLEASSYVMTGEFDGQNHTIKNGVYDSAAAKSGILCAKLLNGSVKNVKFSGCKITSTNESAGIVVGEANGDSSFTNVEISNCTVTTSGNYVGLVYARSESTTPTNTVVMDEITIKNNSSASCAQYGGIVTGDNTSSVTLKNSQIQGTLKNSSNNWGLLLGRTRNDAQVYTVENVVSDVKYEGSKVGTSTGYVCQGKNACSVVAKNLVVMQSPVALAGAAGKLTAENVYYVDTTNMPTNDNVKSITAAELTADWYKTLLADFDSHWVVEDNGGIKLVNASANTISDSDVLSKIELSTGNAKVRFIKGEEFVSTGLLVNGTYESGTIVPLDEEKYTIDTTGFDSTTAGTYTITVKVSDTISAFYTVSVVEQTGISINDEFVKHSYKTGESFSSDNLVVYATWSDGVEAKMTSGYTVDSSEFVSDTAGVYEIKVKCEGFADVTYNVDVLDAAAPEVVDNKVTVAVDAGVTNGTTVDGTVTFSTLQNALDYLKSCSYDSTVKKVINLKNGTYREKVTIDMPNVILNGEDRDQTVIVYDAVESTVNPVTGQTYGMACGTLTVKGEGFEAHNITISNDFDYKNNQYNSEYASVKESSPQGIAIVMDADKCIYDNVHLYGNQDTIYARSGRAYFKGGLIEGNIDFICGEAKAILYFDGCTINAVDKALTAKDMANNGYVTAFKGNADTKPNYGVVFNNCNFTANENVPDASMSLGRPWEGKATVAYINCNFSSAYATAAYDGKTKSRWADMSGNSPVNADFAEYNSTGDGAITEAVAGGRILTEEEAANYTTANVFAKDNGKISFTVNWDPLAEEQEEDKSVHYSFNGAEGTAGTNYVYTENINGTTLEWNGLTIDGTKGKVTARDSDTQINAGATITFTVPANSEVLISNYPGYHNYSLNGVETTSDTFKTFYAEETEVTFLALGQVYLYSIDIIPDATAPAEKTLERLTVTGVPSTEIQTGTDPDFTKLVVKANYSDTSVVTLTSDEYTIDTSEVDNTTAGTYSVSVNYGGVSYAFSITYAASVSNAISETTTFSFKDDTSNASANYCVYDSSADVDGVITVGKLTINANGGTIKDNGDWFQFFNGASATIEIDGDFTLTYLIYNGVTSGASLTVTNNGETVTENADGSYTLTSGTVVITDTKTGTDYLGKLVFTKAE